MELELLQSYLELKAKYYAEFAAKYGCEADNVRAQMCKIILADSKDEHRVKLTIERLSEAAKSGV